VPFTRARSSTTITPLVCTSRISSSPLPCLPHCLQFIDKHLEEMKAISEQPGIKGRLVKALATFPSVGKKASASMTVKEAVSTLEFMLLM